MCTFGGVLKEYPWISIDCFLQSNCQSSRVFFISHIHTDHLRGLGESLFAQYALNNRSIRIHCSEATRSFLSTLAAYKHLSSIYSVVNVNQPLTIQHPDDQNCSVTVTCFGAGHCPGSLMLLFEGAHGTVLYTGDFRLYAHQSNRHGVISSKKRIDSLYIDMTFFDPTIRYLPEREQACQTLIDFIGESTDRCIHLKTSARVGYEYVYLSLYQQLGIPIHVHAEQHHLYHCLPQVQRVLTIDGTSTRLHACYPRCSHARSSLQIVLSVLWFTLQQQRQFKSPLVQINANYYRLCYSLHSSYSEICAFIRQLSPGRVCPIALPDRITPQHFEELLAQMGVLQTQVVNSLTSSCVTPQIKHRYERIESKPTETEENELEFDCQSDGEQKESQLYKRISDLHQPTMQKGMSSVSTAISFPHR